MTGPRKDVDDKARRSVQSVEVGSELLLTLARHPGPMSLKELAERSGLTPSRAHPYLVSFGRLGFVTQHDATGQYSLGASALELGLSCLNQSDPLRVARRVAEDLARQTRQGVSLAVWGNMGATIVHLIEPHVPQHYALREGTVVPMLFSATGRAFAAAMGEEAVALALQRLEGKQLSGHPRLSATQLRSFKEARTELERYGLSRGKSMVIPGINAYGAPIFDHRGKAVAVIALHGREDQVTGAWNTAYAQSLRDAARETTRMLGGGRAL